MIEQNFLKNSIKRKKNGIWRAIWRAPIGWRRVKKIILFQLGGGAFLVKTTNFSQFYGEKIIFPAFIPSFYLIKFKITRLLGANSNETIKQHLLNLNIL